MTYLQSAFISRKKNIFLSRQRESVFLLEQPSSVVKFATVLILTKIVKSSQGHKRLFLFLILYDGMLVGNSKSSSTVDIFIDDSNSHLVVPVTLKYFAEILKIKTQKKFLQKLGEILL